uniref:Uncharacterized protein n=1 Tax=Globodera rostochiensis TaxID=31243 RepID=A0A914H8B8_GLORO
MAKWHKTPHPSSCKCIIVLLIVLKSTVLASSKADRPSTEFIVQLELGIDRSEEVGANVGQIARRLEMICAMAFWRAMKAHLFGRGQIVRRNDAGGEKTKSAMSANEGERSGAVTLFPFRVQVIGLSSSTTPSARPLRLFFSASLNGKMVPAKSLFADLSLLSLPEMSALLQIPIVGISALAQLEVAERAQWWVVALITGGGILLIGCAWTLLVLYFNLCVVRRSTTERTVMEKGTEGEKEEEMKKRIEGRKGVEGEGGRGRKMEEEKEEQMKKRIEGRKGVEGEGGRGREMEGEKEEQMKKRIEGRKGDDGEGGRGGARKGKGGAEGGIRSRENERKMMTNSNRSRSWRRRKKKTLRWPKVVGVWRRMNDGNRLTIRGKMHGVESEATDVGGSSTSGSAAEQKTSTRTTEVNGGGGDESHPPAMGRHQRKEKRPIDVENVPAQWKLAISNGGAMATTGRSPNGLRPRPRPYWVADQLENIYHLFQSPSAHPRPGPRTQNGEIRAGAIEG